MTRRERDEVIAALVEERIDADKERSATLLGNGHECYVNLAVGTGLQDNELYSKHTCSRLHIS
jgi:hypothetical protein